MHNVRGAPTEQDRIVAKVVGLSSRLAGSLVGGSEEDYWRWDGMAPDRLTRAGGEEGSRRI